MTTIKTINPLTGETLADLEVTTSEQIQDSVKRSKAAQKDWGNKSVPERAKYILDAYKEIETRKDEFAELIHTEMGKTLKEGLGEVNAYLGGIGSMAQEIEEALTPETRSVNGVTTTTYYDSLGVCASITPWNFPLGMPHTLMMPSLMAGNTVLFKPSEEVPLIGIKYAEVLNKYLPKDVFQIIIGTGDQGKELVESDVQLITFTGSQNTGKHILGSAAKGLKRVLLELGGKDPLIIMKDADLDAAAKFAATAAFRNCGQVCVSIEKIFVMDEQHDEFVTLFKKYSEDFPVGAMIHKTQQAHVVKQVKDAIAAGAKLELGDPDKEHLSPIILTNVSPEMDLMTHETFGPAVGVMKVESPEQAVQIANNTNYALGGVVFGTDQEAAIAIGRTLNAAMVGINKTCSGTKGSPWVGANQSGYGFHGSAAGHRQFTQVRILSVVD